MGLINQPDRHGLWIDETVIPEPDGIRPGLRDSERLGAPIPLRCVLQLVPHRFPPHPATAGRKQSEVGVPAGGTGFYRTPSLISLWSSAPFLHNNALGKYTGDPSVAGRMTAFDDVAEKLLLPAKRDGVKGIWRPAQESQFTIHGDYLPGLLKKALNEHLDDDGFLRIGHIPTGTPVNLLANVNPDMSPVDLAKLVIEIKRALLEIKMKNLQGEAAREACDGVSRGCRSM